MGKTFSTEKHFYRSAEKHNGEIYSNRNTDVIFHDLDKVELIELSNDVCVRCVYKVGALIICIGVGIDAVLKGCMALKYIDITYLIYINIYIFIN